MSDGYWKWRAAAAKRLRQYEVLDPQVHAVMLKNDWHVICKATEEEDKKEKWDWYMVKSPGTDDEKLAKVDIKFGGVRDDHVKYYNKHGRSHGVTHYAFARKRGDKVTGVTVCSVEHFMANKKRFVNSISGEAYWLLK